MESDEGIDDEISNPSEPRTIRFKTFYWKYEDADASMGGEGDERDNLEIHIAGRTADDKSVHCIVKNFTPFVYLELPKRVKWNRAKCIAVFEHFKKILKNNAPLEMWLLQKYKLKYKKLFNCIRMTFPTQKAAAIFGGKCRNAKNGIAIDGVGVFKAGELIVHETNVDPILKFTASKKLKLASWIEVKETIREEDIGLSIDDRKYSTADIDLYADWCDVENLFLDEVIVVKPTYFSFDIECYSKNHNSKLPDPELPGNFIFSIAVTCGRFGSGIEESKKYLFTLFNPHDIPNVKVIRCKDERDLLLKFRAFVDKKNPDIFVTYNGMKFDWGYMISRAEITKIWLKFAQISRIIGKRAELTETTWSSSAYGEQKFRYLDPMGRTNVDVLIEIERNYKLPQYGLGYVGEYFLKDTKEDLAPRELFMLVQLTMEMTPIVEDLPDGEVNKSLRIKIKKHIQQILPLRRCREIVKKYRKTLMDAKTGEEFRNRIRDALTLTGTYNVQDTVLPVKLAEKLNLWITMEETSNCMFVPMSYLHTRGQQVKVLAQVYRETIFKDIIISYKERLKEGEGERYEGATVIEANPADYNNVVCYDFESLYPSIIILKNICWTTIKEDSDPIPDEECNIINVSSHVGCVHDPKKRKKKAADVLCKDCRYRFKKVVYHPDGTREHEGLMPALERRLLSERKIKKKEMAKLEARLKMAKGLAEDSDIEFYKKCGWEIIEKGSLTDKQLEILKVSITVLNAQQLALKISANSGYGTLGAQNGPIPLIEGASSVTGIGRDLIKEGIRYILTKYPGEPREGFAEPYGKAKLVYGDSVVPYTPVLLRINGILSYVNIEDVPLASSWIDYGDKEYANPVPGIEIWSDKGFTPLKGVIRHYTRKNIYRVLSHTGSVDVTSDHSLLTPDGEEIRPIDVEVGDELLHADLPHIVESDCISDNPLVKACPYSMGFFYGDGSCGYYDCPSGKKASWALNNTNLDFLNRAKKELERYYHLKFKILDTLESSGVYKLVPTGQGIKELVEEWRSYFYTPRRQKMVPDDILNAPLKYVKLFMEGYYAADGDKGGNYRFDNKGQIGAAGLLFLAHRMGYNTSINCRTDKLDIYRVTCTPSPENESLTSTKGKQRISPTKIKKLWDLGKIEDYVYDIETGNHHFAAGVGKMVVHNTDSSMITFVGKTTEESFELGDRISKETSHHLKCWLMGISDDYEILCPSNGIKYRIDKYPRDKISELSDEEKVKIYQYDANPINLQFENLYKRYLLLSKKRYFAFAVNRLGKIINTIKKGIVLARRDNCMYLRDTYKMMADAILENKTKQEVMYILFDQIHKLFTRQIPSANLILYMAIKTVMNYAKKIEKKQGRAVVERVFIDEDKQPIDDPIGPLDPRLVYPNLPQVLLALKMLRRGDDVPPNTRLEFIYLKTEGATHQGEKAEDYTYYRDNKDILGLVPDYLHYVEKQLSKPILELLSVKYPFERIPYEKLDDHLDRLIGELDPLLRHRVSEIKTYERTSSYWRDMRCRVGWSCHGTVKSGKFKIPVGCSKCSKEDGAKPCSSHSTKTKHRTYHYKKKNAQVQYILDSMEIKRAQPKAPNQICPVKYSELRLIALRWKSRNILDRLYNQHHMRKRPTKRATQTGEKLRVKTKDEFVEVFLTKKYGGYPKGTTLVLQSVNEVLDEDRSTAKRKRYKYTYTAKVKGSEVDARLENVPRDVITTWYYRDGSMMKDILLARGAYMCVVEALDELFSPIEYVGVKNEPKVFEVISDDEE